MLAWTRHGHVEYQEKSLTRRGDFGKLQCGCSGYLSFFFTDCLMSKWLVDDWLPPFPAPTSLKLWPGRPKADHNADSYLRLVCPGSSTTRPPRPPSASSPSPP